MVIAAALWELFVGMQMIDIIDNVGPIIPHVNDITVSTKKYKLAAMQPSLFLL